MSNRAPSVPIGELACHTLVGAGLGTFLALFVIVSNASIFDVITSNPSPRLAVLVFVGVLALMIAIGSAITGFIFCATERN
ncbi:MAG: hypothetical protein IT539_18435 [Bradyrhizobiaceae bacterium]|nr:hypothetical protein [Bradyrhizobiaceae bacterium]